MRAKLVKIVAWTLGVAVVGLIIGSKGNQFGAMDTEYAFGGACVGLTLGLFFASRMRGSK
jgi:hypothetical protein